MNLFKFFQTGTTKKNKENSGISNDLLKVYLDEELKSYKTINFKENMTCGDVLMHIQKNIHIDNTKLPIPHNTSPSSSSSIDDINLTMMIKHIKTNHNIFKRVIHRFENIKNIIMNLKLQNEFMVVWYIQKVDKNNDNMNNNTKDYNYSIPLKNPDHLTNKAINSNKSFERCGPLLKKTKMNQFKEKRFELSKEQLCYYNPKEKEKKVSYISLRNAIAEKLDNTKDKYVFQIKIPNRIEPYILKAKGKEDMQGWIWHINTQAKIITENSLLQEYDHKTRDIEYKYEKKHEEIPYNILYKFKEFIHDPFRRKIYFDHVKSQYTFLSYLEPMIEHLITLKSDYFTNDNSSPDDKMIPLTIQLIQALDQILKLSQIHYPNLENFDIITATGAIGATSDGGNGDTTGIGDDNGAGAGDADGDNGGAGGANATSNGGNKGASGGVGDADTTGGDNRGGNNAGNGNGNGDDGGNIIDMYNSNILDLSITYNMINMPTIPLSFNPEQKQNPKCTMIAFRLMKYKEYLHEFTTKLKETSPIKETIEDENNFNMLLTNGDGDDESIFINIDDIKFLDYMDNADYGNKAKQEEQEKEEEEEGDLVVNNRNTPNDGIIQDKQANKVIINPNRKGECRDAGANLARDKAEEAEGKPKDYVNNDLDNPKKEEDDDTNSKKKIEGKHKVYMSNLNDINDPKGDNNDSNTKENDNSSYDNLSISNPIEDNSNGKVNNSNINTTNSKEEDYNNNANVNPNLNLNLKEASYSPNPKSHTNNLAQKHEKSLLLKSKIQCDFEILYEKTLKLLFHYHMHMIEDPNTAYTIAYKVKLNDIFETSLFDFYNLKKPDLKNIFKLCRNSTKTTEKIQPGKSIMSTSINSTGIITQSLNKNPENPSKNFSLHDFTKLITSSNSSNIVDSVIELDDEHIKARLEEFKQSKGGSGSSSNSVIGLGGGGGPGSIVGTRSPSGSVGVRGVGSGGGVGARGTGNGVGVSGPGGSIISPRSPSGGVGASGPSGNGGANGPSGSGGTSGNYPSLSMNKIKEDYYSRSLIKLGISNSSSSPKEKGIKKGEISSNKHVTKNFNRLL